MSDPNTNGDQFQAAAVENEAAGRGGLSEAELDELVASSDTGARGGTGPVGTFIVVVALGWSLFQLWIASPLPFMVGFGVFNSTEARSIHLGFAIFLGLSRLPCGAHEGSTCLGCRRPASDGASVCPIGQG